MHDPERRIDRMRVGRLANPSTAQRGLPLGSKVPALNAPPARLLTDPHVTSARHPPGRDQIDLELEKGFGAGPIHEPGIALFEHPAKGMARGAHANRHAADIDRHLIAGCRRRSSNTEYRGHAGPGG